MDLRAPAASPDDQALHRTVCAEIEGGAGGERLTRVRLADCGKTAAGELLAGLAAALGSAAAADPDGPCVFVFAEQDRAGFTRWATARQFPAAWPQSKASAGNPVAISPSPLAPSAGAR